MDPSAAATTMYNGNYSSPTLHLVTPISADVFIFAHNIVMTIAKVFATKTTIIPLFDT
jgi:hypothetical protein